MTSAQHATFTIERSFDALPSRVFHAWTDQAAKARWFSAPVDWKDAIREQDFRVGGHDPLKGAWPDGHITDFNSEYRDIVPNERIVYVYDMHVDGAKISVSLATLEFKPVGQGTKLIVTEQGAFLDGYNDAGSRERGTRAMIEALEASLRRAA
jgi:uncharacterized protein YndB with AHSA1/START domain